MVGNATEEHLLAIELEALVLGELNGADAEQVLYPIDDLAVLPQDDLGTIEVRCLARPELRTLHGKQRHLHLVDRQFDVLRHITTSLSYEAAVGCVDTALQRHVEPLGTRPFDLDLQLHVGSQGRDVGRGDIETVAGDTDRVHGVDVHVAEQTAARVPARLAAVGQDGQDGDDVLLAVLQVAADVELRTEVAVVNLSEPVPVDPNDGTGHHAFEVEHHLAPLPSLIGPEVLLVAGIGEALESASRTSHSLPREFHLIIVRNVECAPAGIVHHPLHLYRGVVQQAELPPVVQ